MAYTLTQVLPVQGPWSKGMLRSVHLLGPRLLAMDTQTLNSHLGEVSRQVTGKKNGLSSTPKWDPSLPRAVGSPVLQQSREDLQPVWRLARFF